MPQIGRVEPWGLPPAVRGWWLDHECWRTLLAKGSVLALCDGAGGISNILEESPRWPGGAVDRLPDQRRWVLSRSVFEEGEMGGWMDIPKTARRRSYRQRNEGSSGEAILRVRSLTPCQAISGSGVCLASCGRSGILRAFPGRHQDPTGLHRGAAKGVQHGSSQKDAWSERRSLPDRREGRRREDSCGRLGVLWRRSHWEVAMVQRGAHKEDGPMGIRERGSLPDHLFAGADSSADGCYVAGTGGEMEGWQVSGSDLSHDRQSGQHICPPEVHVVQIPPLNRSHGAGVPTEEAPAGDGPILGP